MHCSLCSQGWRYGINMRLLISPRLTPITTAVKSGLTPLILRASNTTTMFRSRVVKLVQFYPKITPETISVGRPEIQNFAWGGGGMSPDFPMHTFITYWNLPSQIFRSATAFFLLPLHSESELYSLHRHRIISSGGFKGGKGAPAFDVFLCTYLHVSIK